MAMIDVNLEVNKKMIAWIFLFCGRRQIKTRPSDKWQKEKNVMISVQFLANFHSTIHRKPYNQNLA